MEKENIKYHYLYKTTNLINDKYYYGMHSTFNLDDNYLGSGKILRYSIKKYGIENFKREILIMFETREELVQGEIDLITDSVLKEKKCMNLCLGGMGGFTVDQQKINAKKSNIKQKMLYETNLEWVKKYSENRSRGLKKSYENGIREKKYFFDWKGRKHTEESKKKMSESSKGQNLGNKNGSYGTCWITKDGENKKVKKEELQLFTNDGWIKGRKIK